MAKQAALAAKAHVEQLLTSAKAVYVVTDWASDSFGRLLAGIVYVTDSGEKDLATSLVTSGHAKIYEK